MFNPSVVRLGRTDAINSNVREFTLEELVERKLEEYDSERQNHKYDGELRKTQNEQLAKRDELRKRQADAEKATEKEELQVKIIALTKKSKRQDIDWISNVRKVKSIRDAVILKESGFKMLFCKVHMLSALPFLVLHTTSCLDFRCILKQLSLMKLLRPSNYQP